MSPVTPSGGVPGSLGPEMDPTTFKACCADVYGNELAGLLLGESYHPGGNALTRRLAETLDLRPGEHILDVACGTGTTALLLASEHPVAVTGVDLGAEQVATARRRAAAAAAGTRLRFEVGDAERLPLEDASVDVVVSECAFCTFPDKTTAAAEMARVLRPGGRLGLSDIWVEPERLDPELRGLAGRLACVADARPIGEVRSLLEQAGFEVGVEERHDDAVLAMIDHVVNRLRALRFLSALAPFDIPRVIELARRAREVVRAGDAGYVLLTAIRR